MLMGICMMQTHRTQDMYRPTNYRIITVQIQVSMLSYLRAINKIDLII